jgi:hypothetical protein
VLELGPVALEVPAVTGVRVRGGGRFAAWSDEDLLTVSVGRYSASITDRGVLVLRKYGSPTSAGPRA